MKHQSRRHFSFHRSAATSSICAALLVLGSAGACRGEEALDGENAPPGSESPSPAPSAPKVPLTPPKSAPKSKSKSETKAEPAAPLTSASPLPPPPTPASLQTPNTQDGAVLIATPEPERRRVLERLTSLVKARSDARAVPPGGLVTGNVTALDELTLGGGDREPCLDRFLRRAVKDPALSQQLEEAGVKMGFGADGTTHVEFAHDTVVSFSQLVCSSTKLLVEVRGPRATFVAADFSKAEIVGTRAHLEGAGGADIRLITVKGDAPRVSTQGSAGRKGSDALCPAGYERCSNPDAQLAFAPPQPTVAFVETARTSLEDVNAMGIGGVTWAAYLGLPPVPAPKAYPFAPSGVCPSSFTPKGAFLRTTGRVKLTEKRFTPTWAPGVGTDGRDGEAFVPQPGHDGTDGGDIVFESLFQPVKDPRGAFSLEGGAGGPPGSGGLVYGAEGAAERNEKVRVEKGVEQGDASVRGVWTWWQQTYILGESNDVSKCIRNGTPDETELEAPLSFQRSGRSLNAAVAGDEVVKLPGGRRGATPARPTAAAGKKGTDGAATLNVNQDIERFLGSVPAEVALPETIKELMMETLAHR